MKKGMKKALCITLVASVMISSVQMNVYASETSLEASVLEVLSEDSEDVAEAVSENEIEKQDPTKEADAIDEVLVTETDEVDSQLSDEEIDLEDSFTTDEMEDEDDAEILLEGIVYADALGASQKKPVTSISPKNAKEGWNRLEAVTVTKTSVTLAWDEAVGAKGYEIQKALGNKKFKNVKKKYGLNMLYVGKLKVGQTYTFRVRYFKKVKGKTVYSDWNTVTVSTKAGIKKPGSINATGTYHDNSWDGVTIQEINAKKNDVKKNLVHDYKVVKGKVVDTVTGQEAIGLKVCKDNSKYFVGDDVTRIKLDNSWDETIEAVIDYDENKLGGDYPVFNAYIPSWIEPSPNKTLNLQYKNGVYNLKLERASVDPYESHWLTFDANYLRADGMYVYEDMPKGDIFVAVATDYTNQKSYARINGTAVNIDMVKKSDAYKYYRYAMQEMVVTSHHKIKELKIYAGVRNANQLMMDYKNTKIADKLDEIETGTDGIVGLGCTDAWTVDGNGNLKQKDMSENTAGVYEIMTKTGEKKIVGLANFNPVPDEIVNNKGFKSLHITNKRDTMYVGKQYPLTAYPYPLKTSGDENSNFDIVWSSSNSKVLNVVDGLLIAKQPGKATITAKLRDTAVVDTFEVNVVKAPSPKKKVYKVPANFKASDGSTFSATDYKSTLKAIFGAITYAKEKGYNYVLFPKMNFYASAYCTGLHYYVPSNMTIEFPKGSELHMMFPENLPDGVSASDETKCEFHIFEFGVPGNDYENRCENSNLIIDTYYGERYEDSKLGKVNENKFIEEYRFAEFGRKAFNCSVQIKNSNYAAGYFITADGTSPDLGIAEGVIKYSDMAKGHINAKGKLKSDSNWISTKNYIKVPAQFKKDGYFMSAGSKAGHYGRYWYWSNASAQLYDIYWYNAKKKLIQIDAWQGVGEYYAIPEKAEYYKISFQQTELPTIPNGDTADTPWMTMHDNGAARDCEIKNTNMYHSATGLFSVVGETDGLYIHNNYVPFNGEKPADARLGDFEDGWLAMRHSVLANNVMDKGEYASGGANNYMHTNYFGNEVYTKTCDLEGHVINNRGVAFLCGDQFSINFYYNKVRYGSICWKDRPSMQCRGHIHKNYSRYNLN